MNAANLMNPELTPAPAPALPGPAAGGRPPGPCPSLPVS